MLQLLMKNNSNTKPLGFDPLEEVPYLHTAPQARVGGGGVVGVAVDSVNVSQVLTSFCLRGRKSRDSVGCIGIARRMSRTCDAHFPRWQLDHVTCDAHFQPWLSYSSQESCVKIWLGSVQPFKSYCGNQQKK